MGKTKNIRVLMTGGHAATTALAVIQELSKDKEYHWDISWVGTLKSIEGVDKIPFEVELFPKYGVDVYSISAAKLQSKFTRNTIPALFRLPRSFWEAFLTLQKIKPQVILSFGGSAALPVVILGYLFRIPVLLHEQTVAAGLSNKFTGKFATKIALARKSSATFFDSKKIVVTGNPLTNSILELSSFDIHGDKVLVVGGSRGSQNINDALFAALPNILKKYELVHQTGELDFEKALKVKEKLPQKLSEKYAPYSFINPGDMGKFYADSAILVGRSGANTVSEILAIGMPSILIPIPWTRMDEQTKNAKFAESYGIATLLLQSNLNSKSLAGAVTHLVEVSKIVRAKYSRNKFEGDLQARGRIRSLLLEIIK